MGSIISKEATVNPVDDVRSVTSWDTVTSGQTGSDDHDKIKLDPRAYRDPPMPFIGKPVTFSIMTDRYAKAKVASKQICDAVNRDVGDAVAEAKIIPVTTETDRVKISSDVQERIARRRCKKDIRYNLHTNHLEIQKALLFRKHTLNLMNHNYSNAVVRFLEPVDVEEARNTVEYKKGEQPEVNYEDDGRMYYDDEAEAFDE